ncbi:sensor domain-containing diguanylate cyclase [Propionivibrio dicarboxylicus]|uniref:diguanylate cyclase n=1 Tax=Propionivibrio dicarboxylicus TaxID=83767 RepID=A0A1G7ZTL4_9RHOO|nr:sensor domain-containing diguanylate cyclase [Propionivibrio dicarboxylicus]SDH12028.1 diguanylate cyclase (GGDEF) domain-containing protein [Propionivibrio dicarboxylicus]
MHPINLLDMRTLLMGNVVSSFVCFGVLLMLWQYNRARFPETVYWLRTMYLESIALASIVARGVVPDVISYMGSSVLLILGALQFYEGLSRYVGRVISQLYHLSALTIFLAIQSYVTYGYEEPNIMLRNINVSAFFALICAQCAWVMLYRVPADRYPGTAPVGWLMSLYCLLNCGKIISYAFLPVPNDYFKAGYYDAFSLLVYQFLLFALTSSLVLMVNRRLHTALEADIERTRCSEAAARVSEARLVRAELASRAGNWELHLDTNRVLGSEGAARIYGIAVAQMDYDGLKKFPLPEYREMLDRAMIRLIRQQVPFDMEFKIRAVDSGQVKDVRSLATFDAAHRVVFGTVQDISDRKAIENQLERLAQIDTLTGTYTRRQFMALAERELARAIRYSSMTSVMMVDVDKFKGVNDSFGHQMGDRVLRELGQLFATALRETDFVGRLGGEEFAVFLPETDLPLAVEVAERLRKAVEQLVLPLEGGEVLNVTVSIGVAPFSGVVANIDSPLADADKALYEAKRSGRNRICQFGDRTLAVA